MYLIAWLLYMGRHLKPSTTQTEPLIKQNSWEFPGNPVVNTLLVLWLLWAWVQSLVGEPRSWNPCSVGEKKEKWGKTYLKKRKHNFSSWQTVVTLYFFGLHWGNMQNFLSWDQTCALCSGSMESLPLDHQRSPNCIYSWLPFMSLYAHPTELQLLSVIPPKYNPNSSPSPYLHNSVLFSC